MPEETLHPNSQNSWFSDVSWKAALIYVALSVIAGGSTGAGLIATKAVSAQSSGISQDQADVRYLNEDQAAVWRNTNDKQLETIENKMVTQKVFDERTNMILRNQDLEREERKRDREYFERLLSGNR